MGVPWARLKTHSTWEVGGGGVGVHCSEVPWGTLYGEETRSLKKSDDKYKQACGS